ncbi:hypothetical protein D3C74_340050 [compost metagenome]
MFDVTKSGSPDTVPPDVYPAGIGWSDVPGTIVPRDPLSGNAPIPAPDELEKVTPARTSALVALPSANIAVPSMSNIVMPTLILSGVKFSSPETVPPEVYPSGITVGSVPGVIVPKSPLSTIVPV